MRRQGFATFVAVVLIALVGMAALAMSSRFSAEARRTRDARAEAQLRQMLLAAARQVQARGGVGDGATPLALPAELAGRVKLTTGEGGAAAVVIEAEFDGAVMRQTLVVEEAGGRRRVRSAELSR